MSPSVPMRKEIDILGTCRNGVVAALLLLPGAAARTQPQQQPAACPPVQAPVCAVRAGAKQSYWKDCRARSDGALVLWTGECTDRDFGTRSTAERLIPPEISV